MANKRKGGSFNHLDIYSLRSYAVKAQNLSAIMYRMNGLIIG